MPTKARDVFGEIASFPALLEAARKAAKGKRAKPGVAAFLANLECQARDQKRLDFHFNASLTTLNLAKAELTLTQENDQSVICSMASVKALYFNQHYLDRIIRIFGLRAARRQVGLDPTWIKKRPEYQMLREYGKIAA